MNLAPCHSCNAARRCVWLTVFVCAALCIDAILSPAWAAGAPGMNESSGRYLFIVDTSVSMQRRAANTQKVVGELLLAGLNGQLRPGDTIGVWTFNDELNAGSFPLQRWMPQARQQIAGSVVEFLHRQPHAKQAQLDKALNPMKQVVKDSDKITVLIISSGDDKISGTPFDNEINESCKLNNPAQRKSQMPFVTVLRARKGEFIGWRVSMPPWPVEFPAFPVEPPVAVTPPAKEVPKIQPAVTSTVPSLIVIGKKPAPAASVATNASPLETAKPEPPPPSIAVQPAQVTKPATSPAAATAPGSNSLVKSPDPAGPSPAPPAQSPPAPGSTTQQVVAVPSAPAKSETVPQSKTGSSSLPASATDIVPDKAKTVASPNVPTIVAPVVPTADSDPAASSPSSAARSRPPESAPAPAPLVQTAVATPSGTIFNRTGLLIAGVVLLLVTLGLVLVYVLMRRSSPPAEISLITRSMDRDKK